jgi:hypothetical protein
VSTGTYIEPLLDEREVARLLKISVATIRRRRLFGKPPEYMKIGSSVRYRPASVLQLMECSQSGAGLPENQCASSTIDTPPVAARPLRRKSSR